MSVEQRMKDLGLHNEPPTVSDLRSALNFVLFTKVSLHCGIVGSKDREKLSALLGDLIEEAEICQELLK